MNWMTVYKVVEKWTVICSASLGAGIFWGFIMDALSQFAFGLDSDTALYWVGFPFMTLTLIWAVIYMPEPLSKVGIISEEPNVFHVIRLGFIWGTVLTVLSGVVFDLEKDVAIYWVGTPTMIVIVIFGFIYISKYRQIT